jgi:ectoine hydroxylase-related dioxygenase (phytanoyl-CoA dioxygenase family)
MQHDTGTSATADHWDLEGHRLELDECGYTVVPCAVEEAWLAQARIALDELLRQEGPSAGSEFSQEPGTARLSDLVNKEALIDRVWLHPAVLALAAHALGQFRLSSVNFREGLPGAGHQDLHPDYDGGGIGTVWAIDEFTAENGATRVVPGTHRLRRQDLPADPGAPHPRETLVTMPAGHVIVYDLRLWHSGTRNRSGARRRALHASYGVPAVPQQLDQRRYLRPETRARLPESALRLLDVLGPQPGQAPAATTPP